MAEGKRVADQGQPRPRQSQSQGRPQPKVQDQGRTRKARRRRGAGARVAGAFLYALVVIGRSAILATLGWVWACDLLGLNKEFASTVVTIAEDTDLNEVVDQLEEDDLGISRATFYRYKKSLNN